MFPGSTYFIKREKSIATFPGSFRKLSCACSYAALKELFSAYDHLLQFIIDPANKRNPKTDNVWARVSAPISTMSSYCGSGCGQLKVYNNGQVEVVIACFCRRRLVLLLPRTAGPGSSAKTKLPSRKQLLAGGPHETVARTLMPGCDCGP